MWASNIDFIETTREQVTAGKSGLFLLCPDRGQDWIAEEFKWLPPHELTASVLSGKGETRLRESFGN